MRLWGIVESPSSSDVVVGSAYGLRHRLWFTGLVIEALLAGLLVFGGSARAAFPGRNGLLAVQPVSGPGIVLVNPDGRGARLVCAQPADTCGSQLGPQWSPDGDALVATNSFDTYGGGFEVIYPDGSCLECQAGYGLWTDAAFTRDPTLLTAVTNGELVEYGIDGLQRRVLGPAEGSGYVWSSRGQLAQVLDGSIWVGSGAALRRVTSGSAVSWSPDGRRIAFVRRGWVMVGTVTGRSFRRLIRGSSPAWSPDGRGIAFFDRHRRLSIVRAAGGHARRVGGVKGSAVDWQPLPAKPPSPCLTPPGSTVVASSNTAIITVDNAASPYSTIPSAAYMGCFRNDGRERLLFTTAVVGYTTFGRIEAAVAGPYGALASNGGDTHDGMWGSGAELYDLRTGAVVSDRGGEGATCGYQSSPPCSTTIDQVVVGSDAVSAVHMIVRDATCSYPPQSSCKYTVEQIQASDAAGVRTLDSVTEPDGSPAELINLALSGDTLTWEDNGAPRSAQLRP